MPKKTIKAISRLSKNFIDPRIYNNVINREIYNIRNYLNNRKTLKKIIKKLKPYKYSAPRINIDYRTFSHITEKSRKITKQLPKSRDDLYFKNLNTVSHRNMLYEKYLPKNERIFNGFHLFPANTVALSYVINNYTKDKVVMDFACGLGNLLWYLSFAGYNCFGFENYKFIEKEVVTKYQSLGYNLPICDKLPPPSNKQADILICVGACIKWAYENETIPTIKPSYLICETHYLKDGNLEKALELYDVHEYNQIITIFKIK